MAVIRFFATNGHRQTKSSAPIDYLLGIYSALTPQQKNERSTIADAIRVARDKNDAPLVHRLNQQLRPGRDRTLLMKFEQADRL